MPIVGKFFPSQKSEEHVFLLLRRHWFTYVAFLAIALVMSIPLFVLVIYWLINPDVFTIIIANIAVLAGSAYLLFIIALLLYGFVDYYLDVYIVTNERIVSVEQDGFFKRKISELYLSNVQDVNAEVKGPFATFINYGDINIQTAGERPNFIFKSIPRPYRISKIIVDLHEAILEEEGHGQPGAISKNLGRKKLNKFSLDARTASVARKRTKDFIKGSDLIKSEFGGQMEEEINRQKSDNIIKNIDQQSKNDKKLEKKDITESGKEMHENEEIDI